jgi:hypothetical protein
MLTRSIPVWPILGLLAVAGCAAQTETVDRPQGLDAAALLQASTKEPGAWTYRAPGVDLSFYLLFILDEPRVYRGSGASFGELSDRDVQKVAVTFVEEARNALGTTCPVVSDPGPGVARLRFTVIGVSETVPYVSAAARVIPIGAAIDLLSPGAGHGGTLTGSVTYGIEAFDAQSGQLVAAAVRRLTPGAFDISSTLGTMDTARAVAMDAAARLRSTLDAMHP